MDQEPEVRRKRGRPPLSPDVKKNWNVTIRMRGGIRAKVISSAADQCRSLSEEIEQRLIQSFEREELETILRRVVNER